MSDELARTGRNAAEQLDELQRGQETPPTLETMEGAAQPVHGQRREVPIPDPGERPGAVRADREEAVMDDDHALSSGAKR
ncbi:MAG: hypothetical protein K0Q72_3862 [Armatimonadetes bacterium]|jgi:hypothetical protein|nr:hypothetical protein [Armatimonadota bacterium]